MLVNNAGIALSGSYAEQDDDRIEELLSRPVSDLHRAVQEAEAQIDDELNRASDPRLRDQIGEGGQDDDELRRAADAARRGAEEGVDLPLFLRRAVEASQGEVSAATDHDAIGARLTESFTGIGK